MKKVLIGVVLAGAAAAALLAFPRPTEKKAETVRGERAEPQTAAVRPSASSERTEAPKPELAPLSIRFDAPEKPKRNAPAPVTLIVESGPDWPAEAGPRAQLDLLLRLPVGVKLASSEGWAPAVLPEGEKEDATGPWSVYEKKFPLQLEPGAPPKEIAQEKLQLTVAEEGINWIISSRAKLVQGENTWQAFGILFATMQGEEGEFHAIPKTPSDTLSAKAN